MHNPHPPHADGTTLQDRYKLTGLRQSEGLNRVYDALDLFQHDITRPVIVREYRFNPAMSIPQRKAALDTFRRAVDFLLSLKHPGIPAVIDSFDEGGRAYLVTYAPPGVSLQTMIDAAEPLAIDRLIRWTIRLCDPLDYLHSLEPDPFVVSNITPQTVFIAGDDSATVTEFGISKVFVHQMLDTNIGPVGYSPPELYLGDISPATDVYGIGATLHHALTGTDPRLHAAFSFDERPIRKHNPQVPEALEDIVMKALHPLTRDRYAGCTELRADLEKLV